MQLTHDSSKQRDHITIRPVGRRKPYKNNKAPKKTIKKPTETANSKRDENVATTNPATDKTNDSNVKATDNPKSSKKWSHKKKMQIVLAMGVLFVIILVAIIWCCFCGSNNRHPSPPFYQHQSPIPYPYPPDHPLSRFRRMQARNRHSRYYG